MYTLRSFRTTDLPSVVKLHLASFKDIGETTLTAETFLLKKRVWTYVLSHKKNVVGYYSFVKKGPSSYFLCWFSIDKKYRGRSLGELLLKDLIKRTKRNKIREIKLASRNRFRTAMKLYLDLGFEITRTLSLVMAIRFVWKNKK